MTSKLPFGLKTKPTRRYFAGGSISFEASEGKLYWTVRLTTKINKLSLYRNEVATKEILDKLLKAESLSEIQTIEVVV